MEFTRYVFLFVVESYAFEILIPDYEHADPAILYFLVHLKIVARVLPTLVDQVTFRPVLKHQLNTCKLVFAIHLFEYYLVKFREITESSQISFFELDV